MAKRTPQMLAARLASSSPVTLPQLQAALGIASRTTTFRYLKQVPHLRSYNHNGRYYTHRDPTRFDRYGLVSLGNVHFSRDTTLAATVQRLVRESPAGRTQKELRALLHVPVHAFLLAAVRRRALRRERMDGVWVYRSRDPDRGAAQRRTRQKRIEQRRASAAALEPDARHRGAAGTDPPSRIVAGAAGAALAGPCATDRPAAGGGGVRSLRPAAGRQKGGLYRLLKLLDEQARDTGRPADSMARARQGEQGVLHVDFRAEAQRCPRCGAALRTQKSKTRTISALATGTIRAREIRKCCGRCPSQPAAVSAQLARLAPPGQRYGYDLIAWVGLQRYITTTASATRSAPSWPARGCSWPPVPCPLCATASCRLSRHCITTRPPPCARPWRMATPCTSTPPATRARAACSCAWTAGVAGRSTRPGCHLGECPRAAAGDRPHGRRLRGLDRHHARPGQRGSEGGRGLS